jgi:nitrate/TMAO reductase-like tetraheme cytochrome c subunit
VLVVALVLFDCPAVRAEEISNEACFGCHGIEGFTAADGKPLTVDADAFATSTHASLLCTTCHSEITDLPHAEKLTKVGPQACSLCHGEVVETYDKSIHGRSRAEGITDAASCTNCHGSPHTTRKTDDPGSTVYPLNLPRTCGVCHGDPELAKRHGIPVIDAYQLYMDSIHGRALTRSGLLVAANCSSCHGFHDIQPREDPDSKIFRTNIPATCGACHAGVEKAYREGSHGRALQNPAKKAPVCITCHTAHQIARVDTQPWKLAVLEECGDCHKESRRTYGDTFHGQVTALGFTPVARCSDCHGAHRVLPAADSESSVAPANLVATCRKCHPLANDNFAQYRPHADPDDRARNPTLYYTTRFMNLLIFGVFAFFGLHTVLWFSRSIGERVRRPRNGEGPRSEEEPEEEKEGDD